MATAKEAADRANNPTEYPCKFHEGTHRLERREEFPNATNYRCDCGLRVALPHTVIRGARPMWIETLVVESR